VIFNSRGIGGKLAIVTDDMKSLSVMRGQLAEQYALGSDSGEPSKFLEGE
jgi:hypothetical protein